VTDFTLQPRRLKSAAQRASHIVRLHPKTPITAIIYSEGRDVDPVMGRIADLLVYEGLQLAGFIQYNQPRSGRRRCDMVLQELASGEIISISQDRGPLARGCHLDVSELLRGMGLARQALARKPDLLLINKFGKSEGEGGGFRPLIADAIDLEVPVLVAVPWRNIDNWRLFSGDLSTEIALETLVSAEMQINTVLGFDAGGESEMNRHSFDRMMSNRYARHRNT
jgi:nucleoside-triphosphatase THEP1